MKRNAFTLTELLIVIGIIVLLMAVGVPSLKAMFAVARTDAAQTLVSSAVSASRAVAGRKMLVNHDERLTFAGGAAVFAQGDSGNVEIHITRNSDYADPASANPSQPIYTDAPKLEVVTLGDGVGVAGITRNGVTQLVIPSATTAPYCFAVRFSGNGALIANPSGPTRDTVRYSVDGTIRAMDSVIGVVVFDASAFADKFGSAPSGTIPSTDSRFDWITHNGTSMLFNRYTGAVMRE